MNNEYDFNTVIARLKLVTKTSSDSDLSALLGISSSAFANFKKRNSIPYDRIFAITNSLNVSFDWVLTGKEIVNKSEDNAANDAEDRESAMLLEMIMALPPDEKSTALSLLKSQFSVFEQKKQLEALTKKVAELLQKVG